MIFGIIILAVVAGIAYFHYSQGMFSAFISAVIAAIAAALAMGLHEPLVFAVAKGKFADASHAIALCAIYGGTYLLLRVAFDKMVPGNVNFGVWPDRIGGAVFGLFAGLFAGGIIAVAAQSMPFGPTLLGYARYETKGDTNVQLGSVPDWARVGRDDITSLLVKHDELKAPKFEPAAKSGLLVPADDFVVGFISAVSSGVLAGETPWKRVHPEYIDELFGNRLGLQPGAKRTAFPLNKSPQVSIVGLFKAPKKGFPQVDGDVPEFRAGHSDPPSPLLSPGEGQTLIVVRARLGRDAADVDNWLRFSLGSLRLVAGGKNFYPVATLVPGPRAAAQRMDDFLVVPGDSGVDLVFSVDTEALVGKEADVEAADAKVASGAFIEFKRLSRANIGGSELKQAEQWTADEAFNETILRRKGWEQEIEKKK